jgi:hypothetical protein
MREGGADDGKLDGTEDGKLEGTEDGKLDGTPTDAAKYGAETPPIGMAYSDAGAELGSMREGGADDGKLDGTEDGKLEGTEDGTPRDAVKYGADTPGTVMA